MLFPHIFCGSGIWGWFSWVVLALGVSEGSSYVPSGGTVIWRLEDPLPNSFHVCWLAFVPHQLLGGGFSSLPSEPLQTAGSPHNKAVGFPQSKWSKRKSIRPKWKSLCLLYSNLRSDLPSLLQGSVGHPDQPWYKWEGLCQGKHGKAGSLGAILEAGCHSNFYPCSVDVWFRTNQLFKSQFLNLWNGKD